MDNKDETPRHSRQGVQRELDAMSVCDMEFRELGAQATRGDYGQAPESTSGPTSCDSSVYNESGGDRDDDVGDRDVPKQHYSDPRGRGYPPGDVVDNRYVTGRRTSNAPKKGRRDHAAPRNDARRTPDPAIWEHLRDLAQHSMRITQRLDEMQGITDRSAQSGMDQRPPAPTQPTPQGQAVDVAPGPSCHDAQAPATGDPRLLDTYLDDQVESIARHLRRVNARLDGTTNVHAPRAGRTGNVASAQPPVVTQGLRTRTAGSYLSALPSAQGSGGTANNFPPTHPGGVPPTCTSYQASIN